MRSRVRGHDLGIRPGAITGDVLDPRGAEEFAAAAEFLVDAAGGR